MKPLWAIVGFGAAVFLLAAAGNAEEIADRDEKWDAVGSTRDAAREVEAAGWKVAMTRYSYLLGALVAAGFGVAGLLL
ncbi:hypothetical protein [Halorarius halobius]|uniref:hypothetical protein n=1 Tax=Halorarius halobius TaxID=2962671 RepID=UPI0020CF2C53|nr:hypothetical protein [Halorarius halobius]